MKSKIAYRDYGDYIFCGNHKKVEISLEGFASCVADDMLKCIIRQFPDDDYIPEYIIKEIMYRVHERLKDSRYIRLRRS